MVITVIILNGVTKPDMTGALFRPKLHADVGSNKPPTTSRERARVAKETTIASQINRPAEEIGQSS